MAYPLDDWLDGRYHTAVEGIDYTCTGKQLMTSLRSKAEMRGLRLNANRAKTPDGLECVIFRTYPIIRPKGRK